MLVVLAIFVRRQRRRRCAHPFAILKISRSLRETDLEIAALQPCGPVQGGD